MVGGTARTFEFARPAYLTMANDRVICSGTSGWSYQTLTADGRGLSRPLSLWRLKSAYATGEVSLSDLLDQARSEKRDLWDLGESETVARTSKWTTNSQLPEAHHDNAERVSRRRRSFREVKGQMESWNQIDDVQYQGTL